jgi:hypothetical protein
MTSQEIQPPSAETMYFRFEGKFKSDYHLKRPLTDPGSLQFGDLLGFGSTWYQDDGSVFTFAYASSKGRLYVVLAKLPDPSAEQAQKSAHRALLQILETIEVARK